MTMQLTLAYWLTRSMTMLDSIQNTYKMQVMQKHIKFLLLMPVRAAFFLIGWCAFWMEIAADWLVGTRDKTQYVREGHCNRCGRCCRFLALIMPEFVASRRWLVKILRVWHSSVLNFEPLGESENALIYRCRYYCDPSDGNSGHCKIYPFRHRLCRFFPRQSLYGRPELHNECGFRFIRRSVVLRRKELIKEGKSSFDNLLH